MLFLSLTSSARGKFVAVLWLGLSLFAKPCFSKAEDSFDVQLDQVGSGLNLGPEAAKSGLEALGKNESRLTPAQRSRYITLLLSYYAFRGNYSEQVATSEKGLQSAVDANFRATLMYYLSDGYTNLGEYEKALQAMNDSILLLPQLTDLKAQMGVLQSAISLLNSLQAYSESNAYAERMIDLPSNGSMLPACVGNSDLVEIAFLRRDHDRVRILVPKTIKLCDAGGYKIITLDVRALDAIDRLGDLDDAAVLPASLALLDELNSANERSDYNIRLADAIAKRYLVVGQLTKAEAYGARAIQLANTSKAIMLRQQTYNTMAGIARVQGKYEQALNYLDVSHGLWDKFLDERSRKDVAYQRIKFQAQDQTNQLKLLNQINGLLISERELQERNKHSLQLLVVLIITLLAVVFAWLIRTWRQRNNYRAFSQIDGLTKISNRAHLITCATEAFNSARSSIAVIIFDMDEFKQINDNFSHATGDWVLKTVSATVSACLRSHDLFGRFGGEEFAICLTVTSEDEAMALAERCRSAIAAIDSSPCGLHFAISASFGIAVRPAQSMTSFEETLARADQALYRAKRLGRNQVASHGSTALGSMAWQQA